MESKVHRVDLVEEETKRTGTSTDVFLGSVKSNFGTQEKLSRGNRW